MTFVQLLKLLIPELTDTLAKVSLYGSIAAALAVCFFGFRLRQAWYSLLVFAVVGLFGFWIARLFLPERLWLCLAIGAGSGLLVSLFTFRLYQIIAFVLAFFCVFGMVGDLLGELYPLASLAAALILGAIAGILAAKYQYAAVILTTSITGGWRAAAALRQCVPDMELKTMLIIALALIAAGMVFQFLSARKKVK